MTADEKEKVVELRLKGLGYQAIANEIGTVTKENVRYYCKTHGLAGSAALVTMNYDLHREMPNHCKNCGATLIRNAHSGVKLFCSEKCRRAWWKVNPDKDAQSKKQRYECRCAYCHRTFISFGNPNRKYCGRVCYVKDRFWTDPDEKPSAAEIKRRQQEAKNSINSLIITQCSRCSRLIM